MRISDWSSDVCSSDLIHLAVEQHVDRDRHARVDAAPVVRLRRQFLPQADAQPVLPGIRQAERGKLFAALIVLLLVLRLLLLDLILALLALLQLTRQLDDDLRRAAVDADAVVDQPAKLVERSEEHTSELQSLM